MHVARQIMIVSILVIVTANVVSVMVLASLRIHRVELRHHPLLPLHQILLARLVIAARLMAVGQLMHVALQVTIVLILVIATVNVVSTMVLGNPKILRVAHQAEAVVLAATVVKPMAAGPLAHAARQIMIVLIHVIAMANAVLAMVLDSLITHRVKHIKRF